MGLTWTKINTFNSLLPGCVCYGNSSMVTYSHFTVKSLTSFKMPKVQQTISVRTNLVPRAYSSENSEALGTRLGQNQIFITGFFFISFRNARCT